MLLFTLSILINMRRSNVIFVKEYDLHMFTFFCMTQYLFFYMSPAIFLLRLLLVILLETITILTTLFEPQILYILAIHAKW